MSPSQGWRRRWTCSQVFGLSNAKRTAFEIDIAATKREIRIPVETGSNTAEWEARQRVKHWSYDFRFDGRLRDNRVTSWETGLARRFVEM